MNAKKSVGTAYVLWFVFGAHYLYLGRIATQILLWLSMLVGIGFIWMLVDLFRIPYLVEEYNNNVSDRALDKALRLFIVEKLGIGGVKDEPSSEAQQ